MKLLDVASVTDDQDGNWVGGYEIGSMQCGLVSFAVDACNPTSHIVLSGDESGSPRPIRVTPTFGAVRLNERPTFCDWDEALRDLDGLLTVERERIAGHSLWFGSDAGEVPGGDPGDPNPREGETWLGAAGVTSVTAGSDDADSLGDALVAFYAKTTGVEPVIHLGLKVALRLEWITENALRGVSASVIVNPGYDPDGIAITGPINLRFGRVQRLEGYKPEVNRMSADATIPVGVEMDPCAAVVVGPLPTHPNQS